MEPLLNKRQKISLSIALSSIALFIILIILLNFVDVKKQGVDGTDIGFATINLAINSILHYSKALYIISAVTGYLMMLLSLSFGALLVYQCVKRKKLRKIDPELFILVLYFISLVIIYLVFSFVSVNYSPVKINGKLKPSFPSPHTLVTVSVFGMAMVEILRYLKDNKYKKLAITVCSCLTGITVICRFLSGANWFTDFIGAFLLGLFFTFIFDFLVTTLDKNKDYILDY